MSSPPQLAYETTYHIWNRGVNRQNIFVAEANYRFFLEKLASHIAPVAQILAYCLLPNHFHIVIRIMEAEQIDKNYFELAKRPLPPSQAFSNCFNSYVKGFNKWAHRTGGLFEGRFGRKAVNSEQQLINLITYIHRNPETHGLINDFREWRYSSYNAIITQQKTRICREDVLAIYGGRQAFIETHEQPVDEGFIDTFTDL